MSFHVQSPAAAAELQNNNTKFYFAILEAAWRKRPEGTFLTSWGADSRARRIAADPNRLSIKQGRPKVCHCEEAGGRRGNLAVLARITEKLRRIRPPERQSRYETVLCLPFDQQRKYCPVHRHDKRPAKKIVRASGRPRGWLYKAILCPKISLF